MYTTSKQRYMYTEFRILDFNFNIKFFSTSQRSASRYVLSLRFIKIFININIYQAKNYVIFPRTFFQSY